MLVPALVCALLAGLGGLLVPRLIAVVPEPLPEPMTEPLTEPAPEAVDAGPRPDAVLPADKELYADIALTPHLAVRSLLVGAVVGAMIGATTGWVWPLVYLLPAVPLGIALATIDWRTLRLPTWYLAPAYPVLVLLLVGCAALTGDWDDLLRAGLGWLVLGGIYVVSFAVSPSFGYGDVRLSGLLGLGLGYLGWPEVVVGGFLAFPLFGVPPLLLALVRRDWSLMRSRIPFGPAMLASAALGVVLGGPLADWYLGRAGLS